MKFFFDEDGDFRFGGRALYLLLHTNWLRYFRKNGKRCWKWTKSKSWMESPNSLSKYYVAYGEDSAGMIYQATASVNDLEDLISRGPGARHRLFEDRRLNALAYLETFLNPDCRCRVGLHWKCGIHGTWRG